MSTSVQFESEGGIAPFVFSAAALRWSASISPLVAGAIRARTPVGKGPTAGALRRSVTSRRRSSSGSVSTEFVSSAPYARYVVDGTRPHVITARNARVLRFTAANGQVVFRRSVNHPGTKPNPFARDAVTAVLPAVRASFDTIMREAMGGTG